MRSGRAATGRPQRDQKGITSLACRTLAGSLELWKVGGGLCSLGQAAASMGDASMCTLCWCSSQRASGECDCEHQTLLISHVGRPGPLLIEPQIFLIRVKPYKVL